MGSARCQEAARLIYFSRELGANGRRVFGAALAATLWRCWRYRAFQSVTFMSCCVKGAAAVCILSFDLEFSTAENPGRDGVAAVDALLSLLRDALWCRLMVAFEQCTLKA